MASRKRSISNDADMHALYKEWDEASCPICMDHPHNAVLLLCSSHDKGCRSYICDTSYRHSNCLDRFRKLRDEDTSPSLNPTSQHDMVSTSNGNLGSRSSGDQTEGQGDRGDVAVVGSVATEELGENSSQVVDNNLEMQEETIQLRDSTSSWEGVGLEENNMGNSFETTANLRCPLCRGSVLGWKVVEEARRYLNLKHRSCSRESCSFSGNYRELRRHARRVHPTVRPADIDPSRQRAWRRLQDQREYDDIVSAIRSAMPGAIVLGDYVIENGDRFSGEGGGRLLSTFLLFQMIGSVDSEAELRGGRSRPLSRHRRSSGAFSRRRFLWGENLLGLQHDEDDDEDDQEDEPELNVLSDSGEDVSLNPRRRRRLTRSRANEDRQ
ncbi:unnamed protein product [Coffea canephora]|uniref:Uncharacterized protein n=2 Tax=Coffea TaxID=13442 RepID=A0A068U6N5_COFCA|nr:unnamed protein product [Coffea canephora]